jgi:hypothetical protein
LQNEIDLKERSLNISVSHDLIALDANINDIKSLIDQKRPEQKIYKSSICDLWLRLKTIEQMGPVSLITFLRKNQLYRSEKCLSVVNEDPPVETAKLLFDNPRRSRLTHCHIYPDSDKFYFDIDSYVGLLLFSYDNQLKFVLNGHYCQRGDILIKRVNFFNPTRKSHREIYDILFKWYFGRSIDQRFLGVGFLYLNGKWRFDLIACDDRDLVLYEYRIFDMYLLTHWLTSLNVPPHNVREMEMNAKNLLFEQYELVKKKLIEIENTELLTEWIDLIGSDITDLKFSTEKFLQTIEKEMENFFKETNTFSILFTNRN